MTVRHVAIVGAGLAGLAAAVAAADAGVRVDVFDAAPAVAAPPVAIDVVPNLMRDLATLGVAEACVAQGFAYRFAAVVHVDGPARYELATPFLAGARLPAAQGMRYDTLLGVLHDAALQRGVAMHWGCRVQALQPGTGGVRIACADAPGAVADLVVLAGATRIAGVELPLPRGGERLPQRWDHTLIPRPRDLERTTWFVGRGPTKCLVVPVGMAQAGLAVLVDERVPGTPDRSSPRDLRARLDGAGGAIAALGAMLPEDAPVFGRPVRTGLLGGAWHDERALRLGSSSHVLPPHFGQAAAQSVEDATVLRDLLQQGLPSEVLKARFSERRAGRAGRVHALCTQAARWDLHPEATTNLIGLAERLQPLVSSPA